MLARTAAVSAFALIAQAASSFAGPCTAAIAEAQARVDARIAAIAGAGPTAPESTAARLHRQPTPGSVARAEENLGEGSGVEAALAALARARQADQAGEKAACDGALADVSRAIGP